MGFLGLIIRANVYVKVSIWFFCVGFFVIGLYIVFFLIFRFFY